MEVIIDGVKYVPESDKTISVHGINYNNVAHWLLNVHASLVGKWCNILWNHKDELPDEVEEAKIPNQNLKEFELLCEKYLGFKSSDQGLEFIDTGIPEILNG